jgi:hypothetical protein
MTEKTASTFEDILSTAKTFTVTPKRCREFENKKWVSKDLVLQQREQLRKLLDGFGSIDDYDNDDVIELIKGLSEVLGSGKEGDEK